MPNNTIDSSSQLARLRAVVAIAGARYDTRVNLKLPISFNFDVLCKTEDFNKKVLSISTDIWEKSRYIGRDKARAQAKKEYDYLFKLLKSTSTHLKLIRNAEASHRPNWTILGHKSKAVEKTVWEIVEKLREKEENESSEDSKKHNGVIKSEKNELYRLAQAAAELSRFTESYGVRALSKKALLITGQAGAGKTHLLCDVASNRINNKLPTFIFLGEEFNSANPLSAMAKIITGNSADIDVFKRINTAAKKKNRIALIIIDAANEATVKVDWSELNQLKRYKNLSVVLSIRTGFEKAVLPSNLGSSYAIIGHEGFGDLDWRAVTNFFKLFSIPLPKVPIVAPEFRNPLFLKLFCQTYSSSGDFKGHLGTTKLFEAYNKKQGAEVLSSMGLPANRTRIWKKIIKPTAQWMAENSADRILESRLRDIIDAEFKGRSKEVLKLLQRNWLLTKIPHYTKGGNIRGYEFRFPYQKFSDHLIARCLLTTHLPKSCTNPLDYFNEHSKLGKIVSDSWNYGLIEALSIQVPERLRGVDLVSIVPDSISTQDPLVKGFLQSIIWRDLSMKQGEHKYFNKEEVLKYVNKHLIIYENERSEFLQVILSISGMPDHPLNSFTLDKYLRQFSMADRDSFWQSFVHYSYEDGSMMSRLIDWAWYRESKEYISDRSLELVSIPLIWFLSATDRAVRDRSTKALIELLKGRETTLIKLMKRYEDVNDPYIQQRIYAVAYGCSLRTSSDTSLRRLAQYIYMQVFEHGAPRVDILLRDYARNVIQLYCDRHPRSKLFNQELYKPPYKSNLPDRVPTIKTLENKYRQDDDVKKDHYSIWSSLMHNQSSPIGDFGNYVVNSNLNRFTGYEIGKKREQTETEILEEFKSKLSKKELEMWTSIKDSWVLSKPISVYLRPRKDMPSKDEEAEKLAKYEAVLKLAVKEFKKTVLSKNKYRKYRPIVSKYLSDTRLKSYERIDTSRAQRWMFNRVMKLGWDPEKHGEFDRIITRSPIASRDRSRTERIGKKYQWIALHELLAMVTDNHYMTEEFTDGRLKEYNGSWQLSVRDIDPTHTIRKTEARNPELGSWWVGASYTKWSNKPSPEDWQKDDSDIPPLGSLLTVKDSEGQNWLNLKAYYTWKEPLPDVEESRRYDVRHKQFWVHVYGYLIHKNDRKKFYQWAKEQDFWNTWMPESHEFHDIYYGEFPDSDAFRDIDSSYHGRGWSRPSNSREKGAQCPVDIMTINDEYGQSGNENDMSVDDGFMIQTPASFIHKSMDLKLSMNDGEYLNSKNEVVFVDPTIKEKGPQMLLAHKERFLEYLHSNDFTIAWTMLGEKQLIGGHVHGRFSKRMRFNGFYTLSGDRPYGRHRTIVE